MVEDEIKAQKFSLVDENGNERASLKLTAGTPYLRFFDSRGTVRLVLRASDKGADIQVFGQDGKYRIEIGDIEGYGTQLHLRDDQANLRVAIGTGPNDEQDFIRILGLDGMTTIHKLP